ncbi:MAG: hypothetical protein ACLFS3_02965 [Candidatus Aenigmatarchaeota archaeon]
MTKYSDEIGPVNGLLIKVDEETGEREYFGLDESEAIELEETYKAPEDCPEGYVGVPKEVRDELNSKVDSIDKVWNAVVRNPETGRYFNFDVAKTAKELTTKGDSTADNHDSHAVLTEKAINELGLKKTDERETENYSEKYEGANIFAGY